MIFWDFCDLNLQSDLARSREMSVK